MSLNIRLIDCSMTEADRAKIIAHKSSELIHEGLLNSSTDKVISRKFLVFTKVVDEYYLVFGPQFTGRSKESGFYRHQELRSYALKALEKVDKDYLHIKGGGELILKWDTDRWEALFGGRSMDYGVYTPSVLSHRQEIVNWLGLHTMFRWEIQYPLGPQKRR